MCMCEFVCRMCAVYVCEGVMFVRVCDFVCIVFGVRMLCVGCYWFVYFSV